jgi:hypothetical protein
MYWTASPCTNAYMAFGSSNSTWPLAIEVVGDLLAGRQRWLQRARHAARHVARQPIEFGEWSGY